jgi:hypothetical protein
MDAFADGLVLISRSGAPPAVLDRLGDAEETLLPDLLDAEVTLAVRDLTDRERTDPAPVADGVRPVLEEVLAEEAPLDPRGRKMELKFLPPLPICLLASAS